MHGTNFFRAFVTLFLLLGGALVLWPRHPSDWENHSRFRSILSYPVAQEHNVGLVFSSDGRTDRGAFNAVDGTVILGKGDAVEWRSDRALSAPYRAFISISQYFCGHLLDLYHPVQGKTIFLAIVLFSWIPWIEEPLTGSDPAVKADHDNENLGSALRAAFAAPSSIE